MSSWALLLLGVVLGVALLSRRHAILTPLGFLVLAVGMTSPVVLRPHELMLAAGAGPDAFIGLWNLWWTRTALEAGLNPFFCDHVFAPSGTNLALHTHAVTHGVLTWPLQQLFGEEPPGLYVVYSAVIIVSFALTGYFTYRLALDLASHHEAAVIAGAIFAFGSFRFANTVRLHVLATEWLVLFVWAALGFIRRPSPLRLSAVAGAGWLLLHASLEYTLHAGLLVMVLAVAEVVRRARRVRVREEARLGGSTGLGWAVGATVAVIGVVASIPFLSQLRSRMAEGQVAFDPGLAARFSADLVDFFVPNPCHPLWGRLTQHWTGALHAGDSGYGLSLGIVAIGLFVGAAVTVLRQRQGRLWLAAGLLCGALSLGPDLRLGGHVLTVPTPYDALVTLLPFVRGSRTPMRWIVPAALCLCVVAVIAWSRWRGHHAGRERLTSIGLGFMGLVLFESLAAPLPMTVVPIPEVYRLICAQAGRMPGERSAVFHVPELLSREKLLYQTVHAQPLVGDVIDAVPHRSPSADAMLDHPGWSLLLRQFVPPDGLAVRSPEGRARAVAIARDFLKKARVRWVVVSRSAWIPERRGASRHRVLDPAAEAVVLENLRRLGPVRETSLGEETLFEFGSE